MTISQIYDRMDELLELIQNNTEDQDFVFNCEMELAALEQLRERLEESELGEF